MSWWGRACASGVLAAALVALPVGGSAFADDELDTQWDGQTIVLAWDGSEYTTQTTSFAGVPVTVPGDRASRAIVARNDGPTAATLHAWVADVEVEQAAGSTSTFIDDVSITWSTASGASAGSLRRLAATDRTSVAEVVLQPGQSTRLVVGYEFDADATSGNRSQDGPVSASFDVTLRLTEGEPGVTPSPTPTSSTGPTPGTSGTTASRPPSAGAGSNFLARTGADVLQLGGVIALAIGGGTVLLLVARRRRREQA